MDPIEYYRPPNADTSAAPGASVVKLYSPRQIAGAAFLGSPIAATLLLAANYRALGEPSARSKTFFLGFTASFLVLALAWMLPDKVPHSIVPAIYTVVIHTIATQLQGAAFNGHLSAGGAKHSTGRVVVIGLACLLAVLLVAFVAALFLPEAPL